MKLDEPTIIYNKRAGSLVSALTPHHYTITGAMECIERLIQRHYGSSRDMEEAFRITCYFYVMYARVVHIHVYGGVHEKLYNWYKTKRFERTREERFDFMRRVTAKERLIAYAYRFSYRAGVTVSRIIDLARSTV